MSKNRVNAINSGNWSDPNTWYGGIFPSKIDEVYSNGNTITIDQNIDVGLITNVQTYFDLPDGGRFLVNDGIVINSDIYSGNEPVFIFEGNHLLINGNVRGSIILGEMIGIENRGTGTIEVSGSVRGGWGGYTYGILNSNTGTISVTGDISLGNGGYSYAIFNQNNGKIIINGIESTENGGYGDQPPTLTYG